MKEGKDIVMDDSAISGKSSGNSREVVDYNSEPVYYCKDCLSLYILRDNGVTYCKQCGSVDIGVTGIEDWLEKKRKDNNVKDDYFLEERIIELENGKKKKKRWRI